MNDPLDRMMGPQEVPPQRLLDDATAASYIGVQSATLAAWRHQKKGPKYLKIGRRCAYRLEDIEEWLDSCCVVPLPPKAKRSAREITRKVVTKESATA
jgi:predicted DNA-binding transcriptional regulator AlpA